MHFVTAKTILSPGGMNLCRGCLHGCIYCDSRSLCYQMDHVFEDIEVKENALELLEQALKHRKRTCMIGTGAMTDPYIPLKEARTLTRGALALAEKYGFGFTLQTKSATVLEDLDLLTAINKATKAVVQMTLTTWDDQLCKILEPNVSNTSERISALNILRDAGIPTVVWLCPVLPFLTDTPENIRSILEACAAAEVTGVISFGMGVTLRNGNREYFYQQLDQSFPGLKETYIRTYSNRYDCQSPRSPELTALFHHICEHTGMLHDNHAIFHYLRSFEEKTAPQMSFF